MGVRFLDFPSKEDWNRIYDSSNLQQIYSILDTFESKEHIADNSQDFLKIFEVNGWVVEIRQRIKDIVISYVLMLFYYEKGIPDNRWYISPMKNGEPGIQYYPDFKEIHFYTKSWFDYFSDTLYSKIFTS